ncbi:class I SAM-dependent methyltransferase [Phytohabitans suffuscus]|uniref:Methyltransferase n=1 Tax=Phytohabitans suffuscus TaxID=624315 RepID=A0A6F8YBT8_9ACTN|nr:class I SAM-dependent methyltransferase [Phytohabitans suffuscus]BCB83520.1 methyltransferase [Phytohabitans suffuscus]
MIPHAHFGERLASVYDNMYPYIEIDTQHAVELFTQLCPPPARVLELGVGTGRVALPLAELGYRVHGIDGSPAMLERLRARDPDGRVTTQLADFTTTTSGDQYDLVVVLLNTFFSAVTKDQQLSCLRHVREQLAPSGRFVVEVFEPTPFHSQTQPSFSVRHLGDQGIMIDMLSVDRAQQLMVGAHTILDGGKPETVQHVLRYAFPFELDLLAEACGLQLEHRWGGFAREPFGPTSHRHVSVYSGADDR